MGVDDPLTNRELAFRAMLTQPARRGKLARELRADWMARQPAAQQRAWAEAGLGVEPSDEEQPDAW